MTDAVEAVSLPIRLSVPANPGQLRLVRMAAATVAADMGFSVQDIEDVRVAVDELAALVIAGTSESCELELCFGDEGEALVVEGQLRHGPDDLPELDSVAAELLSLVADHVEIHRGSAGGRAFRLRKRQGSTAE